MNLKTNGPKNVSESSLFLNTEYTHTSIKQTKTKPQQTLDFELPISRNFFHSKRLQNLETTPRRTKSNRCHH